MPHGSGTKRHPGADDRETDCSLEDSGVSNKKASDLRNRKASITGATPNCAVSIHQNSFPDSSQHGAQVFYQAGNENSQRLASLIQAQTVYLTGEENKREIKPNSDYYLLRDNAVPTVIAEVCFLSNPSEAEMITDENMQEKAAFAIAMGIMQSTFIPDNLPSRGALLSAGKVFLRRTALHGRPDICFWFMISGFTYYITIYIIDLQYIL